MITTLIRLLDEAFVRHRSKAATRIDGTGGHGSLDIRTRRSSRNTVRYEPTSIDIALMRRAIELAKKAAAIGEVPIGALVHCDGEIISEAHNFVETNHDPTGHAEIRAIRHAAERLTERRLNECSLVVTLEPCSMCAGAIVLGRVGRLVYGASDPKAGAIQSVYQICSDQRLNHRPELCGGGLAEDCGRLLSDFFRERRRINKERRAGGFKPKTARQRFAS